MLPDPRHRFGLSLLFVATGCNALLGIEPSRQVAASCDAAYCADAGSGADASHRVDAGPTVDPMAQDSGGVDAAIAPALDASADAVPAGCREAALRCEGATVQRCVRGQFEDHEACAFGCRDGACIGECRPPAGRCRGAVHEICSEDFVYVHDDGCNGDCVADACVPCERGVERCVSNAIERCREGGAYEEVKRCDFDCDTQCGGYPVGRYRVRRSCYHADPEDTRFGDAGACTPRYLGTTQRYAGTLEIGADLDVRGDLVRHSELAVQIPPECLETNDIACADLVPIISARECIANGTACDCTREQTETLQGIFRELSSVLSANGYCAGEDGSLRVQSETSGQQHVLDLERIRSEDLLKSEPAKARAEFGYDVALDGEVLVVGAPFEDDGAGAAYVFTREGERWLPSARLVAAPRAAGDHFGVDVAISGDTLVVSALDHDGPAAAPVIDSGTVFAFRRGSDGSFTLEATLRAPQPQAAAAFGWEVVTDGARIAVGAPNENSSARGIGGDADNLDRPLSGAAYVFRRSEGNVWGLEAYIKASNADAGDSFGDAVALHEDLLVVGADGEDGAGLGTNGDREDNGAIDRGAAYVFRNTAGAWSEVAYLKPTHLGFPARFGTSVALDGRTAVIGASWDSLRATGINDRPAQTEIHKSGAAYVYAIRNGVFEAEAYLKADAPQADNNFGYRVAMLGTIALVSSFSPASAALETSDADAGAAGDVGPAGIVYEFYRDASGWKQQRRLQSANPSTEAGFGGGLALSGATFVVGAYLDDSVQLGSTDARSIRSGAVYVYR